MCNTFGRIHFANRVRLQRLLNIIFDYSCNLTGIILSNHRIMASNVLYTTKIKVTLLNDRSIIRYVNQSSSSNQTNRDANKVDQPERQCIVWIESEGGSKTKRKCNDIVSQIMSIHCLSPPLVYYVIKYRKLEYCR